jgi:hypothetical protein
MALPFKLGRFGRSKASKHAYDRKSRLGLRGSLFLAFMAIAATSIVIAAGASLLLGQLSGMNKALTEKDVPRLTTAMQLSELSESLAANGPTLLNAPNEQVRQQQLNALKETQDSALARLADLRTLGTDPKVVTALEENLKNIAGMTENLDNAARQRLETFAKRETQLDALAKAHTAFLGVIETAIVEARSDLNSVDDAETTYKTTSKRITENVEVVRELFAAPLIKEGATKLLELGQGSDSIIETVWLRIVSAAPTASRQAMIAAMPA